MMIGLRAFHVAWLFVLFAATRADAAQSRTSVTPDTTPSPATPNTGHPDSIDTRHRRIMLTGAVIGGFFGAWAGHKLAEGICDTANPPGCDTIRGTVGGALAGAFVGGAIGFVIAIGPRATHRAFRIGIAWRQPNGR
jgi:hypothetical protein